MHDNIHVIQTANTTETAAMLHRLALHAQGLTGEGIRLRGPKPDLASAEVYARYLIEGLPEIGPQRVDAILRAFGSVRAALLADPSAWAAIIGPGAAQRVWTVLNAPYGASAATAATPGTTLLAQARGADPLPAATAPAAAYIDDSLIEPWAEGLTAQGMTTAGSYSGAVRRFLAWYHAQHQRALTLADLTEALISSYWEQVEQDRGGTIATTVKTAMRSWCRWLVGTGHLPTNPSPERRRRTSARAPI